MANKNFNFKNNSATRIKMNNDTILQFSRNNFNMGLLLLKLKCSSEKKMQQFPKMDSAAITKRLK